MNKENFNKDLNMNSGKVLKKDQTKVSDMGQNLPGAQTSEPAQLPEQAEQNDRSAVKNMRKRNGNNKREKFLRLTDTEYAKKEKRRIYLFSFLVPFFILALSWAGSDFYPLGVRTPLTIDLYHQYAPFLSEIRYKLLHGEDLFFTWHIGLGTNFFALLSYYLASPLNVLMVFFPLEHLTTAVAVLTLLKVGLAGLFMSMFVNEAIFDRRPDKASFPSLLKNPQDTAAGTKRVLFNLRRDGIRSSVIIGLSAAYAVSAFNLSYAWNIMWLDAIALMPLLLLGQDRLLRKKKPFLYIITLAIMLIANYYVSFFNLLFVALYFFVLSFSITPSGRRVEKVYKKYLRIKRIRESSQMETGDGEFENISFDSDNSSNSSKTVAAKSKENKVPFKYSSLAEFLRQGFSLLAASLLGIGLSALLLVPTVISLRDTSASGDVFPSSNEFRFSILHFLSRSIIGSSPSIREGLPNIYVGMLVLLLVPLFFLSRKISRREKALHASLLVFMFISLNSSVLNFIWHGFHYPNQLPHRFAYLYGLTLIIIAARSLVSIEAGKEQLKWFRISIVALIILSVFTEELFWEDWSSTIIYLAIACLFFYFILTYYFEKKKVIPRLLASMFLIVFVAELSLNGISMIQQVNDNEYFTKRPDFIRDMNEVESLLDEARQDSKERSESMNKGRSEAESGQNYEDFYRMEYMPAKTTNDPSLFSYNGFTLFASTSNENVAKMFRKLGYHGNNINSYKYVASTNFMDSLFRMRYLILRDREMSNNQYDLISETKNATQTFRLYRNKNQMPFSLVLDTNIDNWLEEEASPFTYQNQLYNLGLYSDLKSDLSAASGNTNNGNENENDRENKNDNDNENEIFEHLLVNEEHLDNFTSGRKDSNLGYSFNAGEKGPKSKISLEIPVEKDMHVYFFVKVVRSLKVNYNVSRGTEVETKIDSPESKAPTSSERESEMNKKLELKDSREINKPEIFDVGECKKGDIVKVNMEFVDDLDNPVFWAAGTEDANLEKACTALSKRDAGIGKVDNRHLAGTVNLNDEKTILIPIPYDKGWNVRSDGEQIETFALGGGLLAFHLGAGTHNVTLEFIPNGMVSAVIIFLVSLILLVILYLYLRFVNRKKRSPLYLSRDVETMSDEDLLRTMFNLDLSAKELELLSREEAEESDMRQVETATDLQSLSQTDTTTIEPDKDKLEEKQEAVEDKKEEKECEIQPVKESEGAESEQLSDAENNRQVQKEESAAGECDTAGEAESTEKNNLIREPKAAIFIKDDKTKK